MSVLTVVPCRAGSKRLPGKNLRKLAGRPLLDHTVVPALSDGAFGTVLVSTDDPVLADRAKGLGAMVPFLRPAALASDEARSADVCLHAADWFHAEFGTDPDLLVLLQVTSPFRPWARCRSAVAELDTGEAGDAVVGMTEIGVGAGYLFGVLEGGKAVPCVTDRTDESGRSRVMVPCGALYAIRTECLRRTGIFFPTELYAFAVDKLSAIDIDTADDFAFAEAVARLRPDLLPTRKTRNTSA